VNPSKKSCTFFTERNFRVGREGAWFRHCYTRERVTSGAWLEGKTRFTDWFQHNLEKLQGK
jgi:hypothetical protein